MPKFWKSLFVAFLIGVGSWATFNVVSQAIGDLLQSWGIFDVYLQYFILIAFIVLVVYLLTKNKVLSTLKNVIDG